MNNFSDIRALPYQDGGKVIHLGKDDHGRILVIDYGNQRVLNFDSLFEQSCMQLSQPFQLVHKYTQFMALVLAYIDPDHITFLGLGGGSLLRTFHHILPTCYFTAVELRHDVVTAAKEYFLLPDDHRVSITINDAFVEVTQLADNSSDIIVADIYDAYRMEPEQTQQAFLVECARVLTDSGWLVINMHSVPSDRSAFSDMLAAIFPTVLLMSSVTDNSILFVSNALPADAKPIPQRVEDMEEKLKQRLAPLMTRIKPFKD
ncbi:methyltransferase domain-containing protein [Dasania marina]|uniref:spermidine synthase n=1 Tax=Dasania marina TaxID=471499 RepID=UPI0030DB4A39